LAWLADKIREDACSIGIIAMNREEFTLNRGLDAPEALGSCTYCGGNSSINGNDGAMALFI